MAKHNDFDDFFGDDDDTTVIDTRADGRLYRVPLGRLAANLVNPRTDFGTEDQLIDFGKSLARRQNQPCPVVSRTAYLKLWPDHGDRIGDVDYVLVSGERRFRAATTVGLPTLDCVVNDDFAADRRAFMEAVVSENVDRQNFDPIEEAYAVQALVAAFGSNRAVAQHFERVDGWVTQRVLLTHLAREAQDLVRTKAMPLEAARQLGKLARDNDWSARDQLEWWESEQDRRAAAASARAAARTASRTPPAAPQTAEQEPERPRGEAPSFTAVKQPAEPTPQEQPETPAYIGVSVPPGRQEQPGAEPARAPRPQAAAPATPTQVLEPSSAIPEPRDEPHEQPEVATLNGLKRFPYDDGEEALMLLLFKMPPTERATVYAGLAKDPDTQAAVTR